MTGEELSTYLAVKNMGMLESPSVPDVVSMESESIIPPSDGPFLPQEKPRPGSRLTVVDRVYFESPNFPATSSPPCSFAVQVKSDEQPYARWKKVGESWEQLTKDCWLTESSMLCITAECKPERGLELGLQLCDQVIGFGAVPGGQGVRLVPLANMSRLMVRSPSGQVRMALHVFPK